ncbi:hypothetical protein HEK616_79980 (plasmid) [Streptomyces nigrescens]|uniref:Uncharacterized protein n=1 Tax=Streptomyces nigrescens TaxID=1920 RepID=A0ABM8A706_STRNI|nr:hypothetical protein HEK616_79980 [Streptomyces nigrescens]
MPRHRAQCLLQGGRYGVVEDLLHLGQQALGVSGGGRGRAHGGLLLVRGRRRWRWRRDGTMGLMAVIADGTAVFGA